MKIASIDIGTNTVRCLIGEVQNGVLKPIAIYRDIIRLGEGLRAKGELDPAAYGRLTAVLTSYRGHIRESGCRKVRAVGTSALRDTDRRGLIRKALNEVLGYPVNVISGEEEARLTSLGVQAGIGSMNDGLLLDIGGGSTELIRVSEGTNIWWNSLPAGVIHLTEELLLDDPPSDRQVEALRTRFRDLLDQEVDDGGEQMAGTAGTPTTLAAIQLGIDDYDPTLVNGHVLSLDAIQGLVDEFLDRTSVQRLAMSGMEKGREDLIVAGSLMVLEVMDRWGYKEMIVSDWGLLEGIVLDLAGEAGNQ
jgi:exopolyphosphatase/guanosine-5'-triphosphate,3'-diphosphate pyrophosphatase